LLSLRKTFSFTKKKRNNLISFVSYMLRPDPRIIFFILKRMDLG